MNLSAALRARRGEDESGFTLIELMVVVLIIAILIAIAIPTFLGAKSRAQDKSAQSSLRNAVTNAKGIYTDTETLRELDAGGPAPRGAEPDVPGGCLHWPEERLGQQLAGGLHRHGLVVEVASVLRDRGRGDRTRNRVR